MRSHLYTALAMLLLLGVGMSEASAAEHDNSGAYPNGHILVSASQLQKLLGKESVIVVDARSDKDFDGRLVPGAVRIPWTLFTQADTIRNMSGVFVGTVRALEILGSRGIGRNDMVVLYDSVARDGGATASYVF